MPSAHPPPTSGDARNSYRVTLAAPGTPRPWTHSGSRSPAALERRNLMVMITGRREVSLSGLETWGMVRQEMGGAPAEGLRPTPCVCGADSEVTEPPSSRVLWISDAGPSREGKVPLFLPATSRWDAREGPRLEAWRKPTRLYSCVQTRFPGVGSRGWGGNRRAEC